MTKKHFDAFAAQVKADRRATRFLAGSVWYRLRPRLLNVKKRGGVMTRLHFALFANKLKTELDRTKVAADAAKWSPEATTARRATVEKVKFAAEMFAELAAADNVRFDRGRFFKACSLGG